MHKHNPAGRREVVHSFIEGLLTRPTAWLLQAKYYQEKLGVHKHNPAGCREVVHSFIEGLLTQPMAWLLQAKYYQEKLGVHKHNPAGRREVVHSFIEGLHWVLEYYYRGVASWTWFFPYHYAPMISDMVGIEEFHVAFQQGKPFLPFQQLLGVLPSASHKLLPEPYQASGLCCIV